MARKMIGLLAFVATGVGVMVSTFINDGRPFTIGILLPIAVFYFLGLSDHMKELQK